MSLFRRFRRDKEGEGGTEEPLPDESPPPTEPPTESIPEPVAPAPTPTTPEPTRIPPPLPDRPTEPSVSALPASDRLPKCFVCGTPLEGRTCLTCRMTWVE
ncbi:MAG: hypothetical protein WB786_06985 [Thermoplasmata archaeon]